MPGTLESVAKIVSPHKRLLVLLVVLGAVLRFTINDVATYSPADEGHYVDVTRRLSREGWSAYPEFVSTYLDRQAMWLSPTPLRWGYFGLTTVACELRTPCDGRTIAWLSTTAGIVSIVLTYLLGRRLVGRGPALLATTWTLTSPLQLALGRRALQDEVYTAVFLGAFWALVRLFEEDPNDTRTVWLKRAATFVGLATFAFSVKEAFVFPYGAFVAMYLLAPRSRSLSVADAGLIVAPPLLFCLGFVAVGRHPGALFELLRINEASFSSDYSIQYQSGPAHRPLFDLFLLAPIMTVLATGALVKMTERWREGRGERWLGMFLVLALGAFMGLPKNLRFTVILDPVLRLLAAWLVLGHPWVTRASSSLRWMIAAVVVVINASIELSLFDTIFRSQNIYDPTTYDILRALGAIPRSLASAQTNRWSIGFFVVLAGVVATTLVVRRQAMTEANAGNDARSSRLTTAITAGLGVAGLLTAFFTGRMSAKDNASMTSPPAADRSVATTVSGPDKPGRDPMAEGLEALYKQRDPARAVARFREVLATQPDHYGATYQLGIALDQTGDKPAARAVWTKMAAMADATHDDASGAYARTRVAALTEVRPVDEAESMRLGLAALYEKKDATTAIGHFRGVLEKNPKHYGATFQLAKALDEAGKGSEARPYWKKTLEMAEANADAETVKIAKTRLEKKDPVFEGFR